MKFKIITLGCKVNTYESEYMLESLLKEGFIYDAENPSIIIINTCSVTNTADSKSLKIIRHERREHPQALIVACGCSVQNNEEPYQDLDIVIGNKYKSNIVSLIKDYLKNKKKYINVLKNRDLPFEDMQVSKFTTHTRAFIKIEDGCNNFCSYCIIPYTRGTTRSKDFNKVIEEAKTLVSNNHREIVLTGIHTGAYSNSNHDLSDVIIELAQIPNLTRIRLSSVEITELTPKFMEMLKTTPKFCDHLHIPLQSGSDNILKIMNRHYDLAYFKKQVKEIRAIRPDIALTTDVIVGHPYETDEDFINTYNFCQEIGFSKIHVFPYSKRNGTKAASMPQVDSNIKKERAQKLLALSKTLEEAYLKKFINQEVEVLTEEYKDGYTIGFTSNYLKISIKAKISLNTLVQVKITSLKNNQAYAILACSKAKISI